MALRYWKKKLPDREEKAYKFEIKIEQGVFDKKTLLVLDSLFRRKVIKSIDYCVSTGKEADIFRGTDYDSNHVAIKIFRTFTNQFHKIHDYLDNSMMIKLKKKDALIDLWASKEFKALQVLCDTEIAPKPIYRIKNVNIMSFLGENGIPYSQLKDVKEFLTQKDYDTIIKYIKILYKKGIIHSDLSEYNILYNDKPYFIDFAQAVSINHDRAKDFLRRDISNINKFFENFENIKIIETNDIIEQINSE
ncbi:MAG: RIO1 family regulatory kinase/ATPase [Candidatus Anstonellales archaeon]